MTPREYDQPWTPFFRLTPKSGMSDLTQPNKLAAQTDIACTDWLDFMNGKTNIDAILNPCSAEMDRKTYGWPSLSVCFWGKRLLVFTVGRLTVDIYAGTGRTFTCMGGGANGSARYWNLFWPLGKVMWITRKSNKQLCELAGKKKRL